MVSPFDVEACAAEPQTAEQQTFRKMREELHLLKTAGIIEVAVRNPSVAEYMEHWEGRALKAEATIAAQAARIAELDAALDEALDFQREVWGWLESRGLVDPMDPEWDGFVAVIEEHERQIEGNAISAGRRALSKEQADG